MKKRMVLTGMFSVVLAVGLALTGCDNPSGGGGNGDYGNGYLFAGTWKGAGTLSYFDVSGDFKIVAANNSFKVYLTNGYEANNLEIAHGPYTFAGNTAILTITQTLLWWSIGNQITQTQWENSGATITVNVSGNTITTGGVTFTKTGTGSVTNGTEADITVTGLNTKIGKYLKVQVFEQGDLFDDNSATILVQNDVRKLIDGNSVIIHVSGSGVPSGIDPNGTYDIRVDIFYNENPPPGGEFLDDRKEFAGIQFVSGQATVPYY
jgi:hypothetical protein